MKKALILDCWTRKGLAMARALGSKEIEVHACSHKGINSTRFSKHVKKFILFPDPETFPENFRKKLLETVKNENYDCIFPLEESSIKEIYKIKGELEKFTVCPIVNEGKFDIAHDKWKTIQAARSLKVPVPESYCPGNEKEVELAIKKLGFPLIIKPRKSSGSRGIKKIDDRESFDKYYGEISAKYGRPIIQEYVTGKKPGSLVALLVDKKSILADFSYDRIREFPVSGGPGTFWISTDNKKLKSYSAKILKKIEWYGIALVEFKWDSKHKTYKLMEINPRFWGSLAHSYYSGINFPYLLFLLSQGKKFKKPSYRIGSKCRWLIPGDLMHFLSNPERFRMKPSFFEFKNTYYDDLSLEDIRGTLGSIIFTITNLFDLEIWKKGILRR